MASVETHDGFPVYSKDESQDLFAVLLEEGLEDEWRAGTADSAVRETRIGENFKTWRHGTGREQ